MQFINHYTSLASSLSGIRLNIVRRPRIDSSHVTAPYNVVLLLLLLLLLIMLSCYCVTCEKTLYVAVTRNNCHML